MIFLVAPTRETYRPHLLLWLRLASASPRTPRNAKGALVYYRPSTKIPSVVLFQYNPDTISRRLQPQVSADSSGSSPFVLTGPPIQTISFELDIDATDSLESKNPSAVAYGILPQLAALEVIMYPPSSTVMEGLANKGLGPQEAPLTVLILGNARALPVLLTQYAITEQAFDTSFNPIRARVALELRVLSYQDFKPDQTGFGLFLTYQVDLENLGSLATINDLAATGVKLDPRNVEKGGPKINERKGMPSTQKEG